MNIHPGAEPKTDAEKAVVGFLDAWGPGAWPHMRDCCDQWMTDDISWENTGSPATKGKAAAVEFLTTLHDTLDMEYCTAELRNIASNGDIVLTERVDRVHAVDGTVLIEIPIMGAFTVVDGRIARYADYNADFPIKERFPRHRH
ncbi:limonene-1,2-epoxide hydrolase family protein [Mycolicibacterium neoaurum]|uniref:limonene-1,2-epoxide hydrolase family protein n=1 Tax=Mycolicibacterium neoaurum TaxID=1795 RepID=UPI00267303F4|nr:limonene-1,2-epoxide hydrolase family protein [Mycolicibacterium neoaurum]MDO3402765.1 limonene-1,2-epoxide hydrolase family protein [Mycolicibacterium neoaurum]